MLTEERSPPEQDRDWEFTPWANLDELCRGCRGGCTSCQHWIAKVNGEARSRTMTAMQSGPILPKSS